MRYLYQCQELILKIVDVLLKCSDCDEYKKAVVDIIANLTSKGLLKGFEKSQVLKITNTFSNFFEQTSQSNLKNTLKNYSNQNNNIKQSIAYAIGNLANENLLQNYEKDEILKLKDLLAKLSNDPEARMAASFSQKMLISMSMLNEDSEEEALNLKEKFKQFSNVYENSATNSARSIKELAYLGFFKGYSKEQIVSLINILEKCVIDNSAKQYVKEAISRLNDDGCFRDLTAWNMSKIRAIYNKCSNIFNNNQNFLK